MIDERVLSMLTGYGFRKFSELGSYPIAYVTGDYETVCSGCLDEEPDFSDINVEGKEWDIVDCFVNYENPFLFCCHCGDRIESAYCEDEYTIRYHDGEIWGTSLGWDEESAIDHAVQCGLDVPDHHTVEDSTITVYYH